MGTGYVRDDVSDNIADTKVIDAADLDGEFDALLAAFVAATGHTHDGTAAEGGPVSKIGPAQEYLSDGTSFNPKTDDTYDLGTAALQWKDLYLDGTANLDDVIVTVTATFAGATIADLGTVTTADINGGTIDGASLGASAAITSIQVDNLNLNGNTISSTDAAGNVVITPHTTGDIVLDGLNWPQADGTIGQLLKTDGAGQLAWVSATTVDFTSVDSDLKPDGDNTRDIGGVGEEWKDLFIDGTANIDSLVADTADINGGTVDGAVIGGSSAAAITCTTLTTTGNVILGNAATDTVTVTADVASDLIPGTDNSYDLGAVGSEWKDLFIDGTANIDSLVADTADINGGTVDGVTIGTASACTELQVDNINVNGDTITASSGLTMTVTGDVTITPSGDDINLNSARVLIEQDLVHVGDTNNLIKFGTDTQSLQTGGTSRLDISNSGVRMGAANARVTTILDEDAMGTDSATALATQQSIKAYVDTSVAGTGNTLGTAQATTSGTAFDYTSIPAGVNRIDILLRGISLDGTDNLLVQIGDSGGIETSGYVSSASYNTAGATSTAGMLIRAASATRIITGTLSLFRITGNEWVATGTQHDESIASYLSSAGSKTLSAELDRVRLTRDGSDDFDAGQVNIITYL